MLKCSDPRLGRGLFAVADADAVAVVMPSVASPHSTGRRKFVLYEFLCRIESKMLLLSFLRNQAHEQAKLTTS